MKTWAKSVLLFAGMMALNYCALSYGLQNRFYPGTEVNSIDLSFMKQEEAEKLLAEKLLGNYELSLKDIHGAESRITGTEIELRTEPLLNDVEKIQGFDFPFHLSKQRSLEIPLKLNFSEERLEAVLTERFFQAQSFEAPRDAFVTVYVPGSKYMVAPEKDGDRLNFQRLSRAVGQAIEEQRSYLDLSESDAYEKAEIRRDNAALLAESAKKNEPLNAKITYDFGERGFEVNGDVYADWLIYAEDGMVSLDEEKMQAYLKELKKNTDTAGTVRAFRTADGRMVNVKGPYGYNLSLKGEMAQLTADILSGTEVSREPVYTTKGADRHSGNQDYGSTYIEIDLTKQQVYLWKDGVMSFITDCVSGNVARGHGTPDGIYPMTYKTTNAILRGEDYESPVSYWMPFNRGIGLHDASWRNRFGGEIYRRSGSHGCINLPVPAAKKIYQEAYQGQPVICHY